MGLDAGLLASYWLRPLRVPRVPGDCRQPWVRGATSTQAFGLRAGRPGEKHPEASAQKETDCKSFLTGQTPSTPHLGPSWMPPCPAHNRWAGSSVPAQRPTEPTAPSEAQAHTPD